MGKPSQGSAYSSLPVTPNWPSESPRWPSQHWMLRQGCWMGQPSPGLSKKMSAKSCWKKGGSKWTLKCLDTRVLPIPGQHDAYQELEGCSEISLPNLLCALLRKLRPREGGSIWCPRVPEPGRQGSRGLVGFSNSELE